MPITLLDGILLGFTLVSAMLAMVRGFSREILSIASWAAAAIAAFFEDLEDLAPRTRNHFRQTLRHFLKWCVKKDFLAKGHSLSDELENESVVAAEPEIITRKLLDAGRDHLVMTGAIPIRCPVRILQGMKDDAVPYAHALAFAEMLGSQDVEIALSKSGDHRLSTPADLARLTETLDRL